MAYIINLQTVEQLLHIRLTIANYFNQAFYIIICIQILLIPHLYKKNNIFYYIPIDIHFGSLFSYTVRKLYTKADSKCLNY